MSTGWPHDERPRFQPPRTLLFAGQDVALLDIDALGMWRVFSDSDERYIDAHVHPANLDIPPIYDERPFFGPESPEERAWRLALSGALDLYKDALAKQLESTPALLRWIKGD